jgi:glutamine amidotransferase/cyclase
MPVVHLLDYAAGNIRSLVNAIEKLGWQVEWVKTPADVHKAEVFQSSGGNDDGQGLSSRPADVHC